jgi:hygromycin-B 4-O-kinase
LEAAPVPPDPDRTPGDEGTDRLGGGLKRHVTAVDLRTARTFLRHRYGSAAKDVLELGGGDWSRAFSFRLDGEALVARFGRYPEDYLKDHWAMSFSGPDLPVPIVLEIGDAFGGAYAISELHEGRFLETLDEPAFRRLTPGLLRVLDALRLVPVAADAGCRWRSNGETDGTSWRQWLQAALVDTPGERVSGWRAKLSVVPELDDLFRAGERALGAALDGCPEVRHVLHLDLLNRNVLVTGNGQSIEAIFDWGCLAYGDYLYEVAWFTFWQPWHDGLAAIDFRSVALNHYTATGVDVPRFDDRLRVYELHIGLTHLAYCAFARHASDLFAVARRLREVLNREI